MNRYVFYFVVLLMTSCSQATIETYEGRQPQLDLREFFSGELKAYGILQNRKGEVTRKFSADIQAWWEGETGYLDETFYFDDGEVSKRLWTLEHLGDGRYSGTADDVEGVAMGQVEGFAFHWVYDLNVPYKDGTIKVKLDDWLYLVSENRLLNKTVLRKFGFGVGKLTLVIERLN